MAIQNISVNIPAVDLISERITQTRAILFLLEEKALAAIEEGEDGVNANICAKSVSETLWAVRALLDQAKDATWGVVVRA